jgi:hypothetical protein
MLMNFKYLLYSICCLQLSLSAQAQDVVETTLEADGPGETYELLSTVLGGTPYEVPDCDHAEGFQHIDEVYNDELQKDVFRFFIHKDIDTDRCKTKVDRQRNEIKTYGPSPDYLLGNYGETFIYEWLFKIDEGFQPSSSFTHIFQLKASGGSDHANPIFTITPRKSSPDRLELIYGAGNDQYTTVATAGLDQIKGKWVRVYCEATFVEDAGDFNFNMQLLDGTEVISFSAQLDLWRDGADFVRPKWGIYRSLNNAASLRDETVLFADFSITQRQGSCPVWYEDADGDGLGDPNNPLVSCSQPAGYVDNDDDMACRYYYEDADGDDLGDPSVSKYSCEQPEGYVNNNADKDCATYYEDADDDGLGNPDVSEYSCEQPEGYVLNNDDDDDDDNNDNLPTAVEDATLEKAGIYPTITNRFLKLTGISNQKYVIFDLFGSIRMEGKGTEIDVSTLNTGLYIIRVGAHTFRFIKE